MSTLTIVIILLIAVVVGAVMLFNFWQSRVNRREAERLFRQETGALDEQANVARRRRSSFNQPPAEDPLLSDVDLPLYANDPLEGQGGRGRLPEAGTAGSPFDDDAVAGVVSERGRRFDGLDEFAPFDDAKAGRQAGARDPDPLAAPDPMSADDGVVADRARLRGFADDLRRITDRMPASPDEAGDLPAMSSRASVAPAIESRARADADRDAVPEGGQPWPARGEPSPMAVTPGEATAHRQADEASARAIGLPTPAAAPDPYHASDPRRDPGPEGARGDDGLPGDDDDGAAANDDRGGRTVVSYPPAEPMSVLASVDGGTAPAQAAEARFPDIDLMVELAPANPINSDRLIALASSLRHAGSKPIRIEIRRADGPFLPLQSGVMVAAIRLSVLLANRQGPLNAVELSDFMSSVASLADHLGASFAPPDLNQVLGRARAVDSLAAELDTQVEILVETPERLSASQVAKLSRDLRLYDRGAGNFASLNDGGEILFMMSVAHPEAIRFTLDVPRVGAGNDPWRSLVDCATRCAESVGGRVTDVEGRGLSVGMIDAVSRQLGRRHEQLARAGLVAGSTAALRVFN